MPIDFVERLTGVGAYIVAPDAPELGFVSVVETKNKRSSNKLAGMRSVPMETMEVWELTHDEVMHRLLWEEVRLNSVRDTNLTNRKLGRFELTDGVVLHTYVLETELDVVISLGSETDVKDPKWTPLSNILCELRGSARLQFRPAVLEIITTYLDYIDDPSGFSPRDFAYDQLASRVPEEIFDMIDKGVSVEAALSRYFGSEVGV